MATEEEKAPSADKIKFINVDLVLQMVEQVCTHLEGESDGTAALFLALFHEHIAHALGMEAAELSRLAGVLMADPDLRDHVRKVVVARAQEQKLADAKPPIQ